MAPAGAAHQTLRRCKTGSTWDPALATGRSHGRGRQGASLLGIVNVNRLLMLMPRAVEELGQGADCAGTSQSARLAGVGARTLWPCPSRNVGGSELQWAGLAG